MPRRHAYPRRVLVLTLVPILLGLVVAWGGFLGWREKLPRDRGAGLRTAATMASDEAFALGNKVAGLPTLAGGMVGVLAGVAGLLSPTTGGTVIAVIVGLAGLVALTIGGAALGTKAAAAVPAPEPAAPAGCSGCACGAGGCGVLQKTAEA